MILFKNKSLTWRAAQELPWQALCWSGTPGWSTRNARIVKASRAILFFHRVTCRRTGAFTIQAILLVPKFQDLGTLVVVKRGVKSPLPLVRRPYFQKQIQLILKRGIYNWDDYFTKHHPLAHRLLMQLTNILYIVWNTILPPVDKYDYLRGCIIILYTVWPSSVTHSLTLICNFQPVMSANESLCLKLLEITIPIDWFINF